MPTRLTFEGAGGLALAADRWGDPAAPPVLFLHGGGQTRHAWARSARSLAAEGRCAVSLDLRGHGDSDWDPAGEYGLESFAADLEAILTTFDPQPVLVGASLGGLTALLAAGEYRVFDGPAVVLVDVAPRLEPAGTARIIAFMSERPEGFASLDEAADAVAAYTRNRRRDRDLQSLRKNLRLGEDGRYRWHWDPAFMSGRGPAALLDHPRLMAAARNLDRPTLVVRGRQSDVLSQQGAEELVEALPQPTFADVTGAGHMVAGDRNDAFTRVVSGFIREHVPI